MALFIVIMLHCVKKSLVFGLTSHLEKLFRQGISPFIIVVNQSKFLISLIVKEVILCFLSFCLSLIVLRCVFVHVKGLRSEKPKSPLQRGSLCPTENTAPALSETPGLESSLYLCNVRVSLCNRC